MPAALSPGEAMSTTGSSRRRAVYPALARIALCGLLGGTIPTAGLAQAAGLRANALRFTDTLKSVRPPDPTNLLEFVSDRRALVVLGKALFWDQQVGSDGQACASCHFHAGADNRSRNQLNPGFRNQSAAFQGGDTTFGNSPLAGVPGPQRFGPNYQLTLDDFPLHRLSDPEDVQSPVLSDTNDVVSSQGVFHVDFVAAGIPADFGTPRTDGVFEVGDALVRNVEPRNTPSSINAALNHRNFWDGRARNEFNGVNPIGGLDPGATVVRAGGTPQLTATSILDSSAASQADGPPLSDLEMSYAGRSFAHLGRKMLSPALEPLAQQLVAADDGVLGPYSNQQFGPGVRGTTLRYSDLVKQAIQPAWWDAPGWKVDVSTSPPSLVSTAAEGPNLFSVMEYNFSLYFGLAVAEYEKTLISDDAPFDRWLEGRPSTFGPAEMAGLQIFLSPGPGAGQGRCIKCHYGPALTGAAFTNVSLQRRPGNIERMVMGDFTTGAYDTGYYNIGVRPADEDLGIGATIGPHDLPLSTTQLLQDCVKSAVQSLRNADPTLELEDTPGRTGAIRQANGICRVPAIPARPNESARVLAHAAQLAVAIPVDIADIVALLATANELLTGEEPLSLNFIRGTALTAEALSLFEAKPGLTPEVTKLLTMAKRLMPDPVAPPPGVEGGLPAGPPLRPDERVVRRGAFKTPSIRNVELTAPYFHSGGQATLEQVVEFYDRGGDFHAENVADLDADIADLGLSAQQKADLVAFLRSLTDDRVRYDRAPFDHPSLDIPNGGTSGTVSRFLGAIGLLDDRVELPVVGAGGSSVPLGTPGTPFANFPDALWSAMAAVSGREQSAAPGAPLALPLVVKIVDDRGNPVAGVPVSFTAPNGGSAVPGSAVTGPDGTASTTAALAPFVGLQIFVATAPVSGAPISFEAQAVVAPQLPAKTGGGCGTAGAGAPAVVLALGAFLVRLRRRSS
jgi:cytochrome c peroxidase